MKYRKAISLFASFSLVLQTFLPLTLAMPVYAEGDTATDSAVVEPTVTPEITPEVTPENTPTVEPTPEVTPEITPEVTITPEPTPTIEVTPSATPTPTVEVTPTVEPTPEITPEVTPEPVPTPEVSPEITPTPTPSPWTFENVELGKEYVSPQNSEVKLTFTKLPSPAGNIKIEEITLTPEQIKQTGSLSDKAYDITSDMTDGSFSYNLSLPIPEASKGKAVEVKFAEELSNIGTAEKVENTLTKTDTSVSVTSLDHFTIFVVTDQTPIAPLSSPDSSVQPRYISGFGLDNSYTIFYEDRNDTVGCAADTFRIHFMTTTNGPAGLSAPVQTNICDTHFTVKDFPITISEVTYAYRAWGAGTNSGTHNFYVSNDLINWTPVTTFTFNHPSDGILYGFHDIVKLNGHYIGWVESAGSNTYIASSVNGDENWTVGDQVGGATAGAAPLSLYFSPGITGPKPSGNFVLIELDGQLTYAKIYLAGDYSGAYMAINRAAAQAATPVLAEAAFMNLANWTWRDGTTGLPGLANTVISNTTSSGGHDIREGWTVPMSSYQSDYVFLYSAGYSTGAKGLGYLVAATNPACTTTCYVNDATGNDAYDGASADSAKKTIQAAITQVSAGGTVNVAAGTYIEVGQIVINKNLSIVGADKVTTIIKPAQDTGNDGSGNSRGWFLVNSGKSFTLENVTLDGTGKNIHTGIRNLGNTTLTGNIIKNISYPGDLGFAVNSNWETAGDTLLTVKNNTFSDYGRVGVHVDQGSGTSMGLIDNNIFIGKGEGDHLDYAIEVETGASATITNNNISNNKGITSIGGFTSAGILATTYWGPGTNITLTDNSIHDNSYGVVLGLGDSSDTTSVLQFDGNIFNSNTYDFDNSTVNNIDARNNTWSVADQNSLDQIEAKINHNCSNSIYVHGVCSGTDDYNTGSMVRYKDIDTTPDAFSFTDQTDVALNTVIESDTITVAGINVSADVWAGGAEYSVNGGAYTSISGVVSVGDTVKVRHTSSASNSASVDTILTIGDVSDTFTSTTLAAPRSGGSGVSDGKSPTPSAPVCNDTKPGSAPVLLSAVAGINSVTLTWSAASTPVTYYLVTYGTGPGLQQFGNPNVGGAGATSYTVSGLSGGTYYFKVRAGNGCMPGDYSDEVSTEVSATPGGVFIAPATGFQAGVLGTATEATPTAALSVTPSITETTPGILGSSSDDNKNNNWWWLLLLIPLYFGGRQIFKKK